jgi:hypothetical protein
LFIKEDFPNSAWKIGQRKNARRCLAFFVISFVISEEQEFTAQSASSWGTGQGARTKGFIFRYKPTHAASFLSRPYVTLRNSPQVTEDLV